MLRVALAAFCLVRWQGNHSFAAPSRRQWLCASLTIPEAAAPRPAIAAELKAAAPCVRQKVLALAAARPELAPALLRLAFHDAATWRKGRDGPNGSIRFELARNENVGPSLRAALQQVSTIVDSCQVSWADAIAVGGAAAVEALGGPVIPVDTGRKDVDVADAEGRLPDAALTAGAIRDYFRQLGLSDAELVALVGAHTVGRWTSLFDVTGECMAKDGREFWECTREQGRRLPFTSHPAKFNNEYFKEVLAWEERQKLPRPKKKFKDRADSEKTPTQFLLPSDIGLTFDPGLHKEVERFATDEPAFFAAFARAYQKLVS
ncbi:unnamed protein product [Effrenium voratum]|nr:unnamed protein product [Effrenium voratum]